MKKKKLPPPMTPAVFDDNDIIPEPEIPRQSFVRRTWVRPRTNEAQQRFQVYVPESLAKKVRLLCVHLDCSYSTLMTQALADYVSKHGKKFKS
jgi:hypothetical protein